MPQRLAANENFSNAVRRSDEQNAEIESNNALFQIVVGLLSEKTEFARNYLDNPQFQAFINQRVFNQAYIQAQKSYRTFDGFGSSMMAAEPKLTKVSTATGLSAEGEVSKWATDGG